MDLLETPAMIVRPKIPSQNFSADMNFNASWASSGAKKYREMQLSRPPQKELQQAVASALARLTLQRHLVPLYRRCRRRRGAGRMDEDGGDGAAEDGAAVNGAEDDKSVSARMVNVSGSMSATPIAAERPADSR